MYLCLPIFKFFFHGELAPEEIIILNKDYQMLSSAKYGRLSCMQ